MSTTNTAGIVLGAEMYRDAQQLAQWWFARMGADCIEGRHVDVDSLAELADAADTYAQFIGFAGDDTHRKPLDDLTVRFLRDGCAVFIADADAQDREAARFYADADTELAGLPFMRYQRDVARNLLAGLDALEAGETVR